MSQQCPPPSTPLPLSSHPSIPLSLHPPSLQTSTSPSPSLYLSLSLLSLSLNYLKTYWRSVLCVLLEVCVLCFTEDVCYVCFIIRVMCYVS